MQYHYPVGILRFGSSENPNSVSTVPMRCRPVDYDARQSSIDNTLFAENSKHELTRRTQDCQSFGNDDKENDELHNFDDTDLENFWNDFFRTSSVLDAHPPTSSGDDQNLDYHDDALLGSHHLPRQPPSITEAEIAGAVAQTSSFSEPAGVVAQTSSFSEPAGVVAQTSSFSSITAPTAVIEDTRSHSKAKGRPRGMTNKKRTEVHGGAVVYHNKVKDANTRNYLRSIHESCKQRGIKSPPKNELEEIMSKCKLTKNEVLTFLAGMRFRERRDRNKPKKQRKRQ